MQTIPFPITALNFQEIYYSGDPAEASRTIFEMWGGEVTAEIIVSTCGYGFPSVVMVFDSCGNGVTAAQWAPYDKGFEGVRDCFKAMYSWIADTLNEKATGKKLAVGTFSDFVVAEEDEDWERTF